MAELVPPADGDSEGVAPERMSPALLLINLGRALRNDVDAELRGRGMSLRLMSALGHLSRRPGLSNSELARRAGITVQSMQAALNRPEEPGAVIRRSEGGRGRTAWLEVTGAGREMLERAQQILSGADQRVAEQLGAEQHHVLGRLLWGLLLDRSSLRPLSE